ncbi:S41 family peptidase [Pelotomaculum propionicicum]|uniref:S41 family peptidase n=1 Tax=Pelotomaculum propionicicum TaxID=258475 RepID=UPI003B798D07
MRKNLFLLTLLIALVLTFSGAAQAPAADNKVQGLDIDSVDEIIMYVELMHISEPDSQVLIQGAIEGLLKTLNDPYTVYMTPEELKEFVDSIEGNYVGIGIQMQPGETYPEVLNTFENTPASKAGIMPGDMIIKIDGADIAGEPLGKIVERVRGQAGTKLKLTIRREGMADFEVELTRDNISTPTVTGRILEGDIAYIRINTFGDFTGDEFKKILDDLTEQGASKLILDLRDNPGGTIHSAVNISSNFVGQDKVVASTFTRNGERKEFLAEWNNDVIEDMPMVILVNQYTASASELMAGAMQDYGLATLIGGQTFGKGTVQVIVPLETGGALKITVARYHTPLDREIDGTGLSPDIQVLTPGLSLAVAQGYLNGSSGSTIVFDLDKGVVMVNGVPDISGRVIRQQGETYLPLRLLFESMGYRVDWQPGIGAIEVTKLQSKAVFYPGDGHYVVDGRTYPGEESLLSLEGSLYIHESVLNLFNARIRYEGSTVIIEK